MVSTLTTYKPRLNPLYVQTVLLVALFWYNKLIIKILPIHSECYIPAQRVLGIKILDPQTGDELDWHPIVIKLAAVSPKKMKNFEPQVIEVDGKSPMIFRIETLCWVIF